MSLMIIERDITKMKVDAIVNPACPSLLGSIGWDSYIHRMAGPQLREECLKFYGCDIGSAEITGPAELPCKHVIHAVGPRWHGGTRNERENLISSYRAALALAKEYECKTLAFVLISSGAYGYPKPEALRIAVDIICEFLNENEMTIYITIMDRKAYKIDGDLNKAIARYINDHFDEEYSDWRSDCMRWANTMLDSESEIDSTAIIAEGEEQENEHFVKILLEKIKESNMTEVEVYKNANIDREIFLELRDNKKYRPHKRMIMALALALHLSLDEMKEFLKQAGFEFTNTKIFDTVVEYFVVNNIYNVFYINEALFAFKQDMLGAALKA